MSTEDAVAAAREALADHDALAASDAGQTDDGPEEAALHRMADHLRAVLSALDAAIFARCAKSEALDRTEQEFASALTVIGNLGDALREAGIEVSAIVQDYPAHVRQLAAERDELQHHADRLREVSAALVEAGIPVPRLPVVEGVRTLARQRDALRARLARAEAVVEAARWLTGPLAAPEAREHAALARALAAYDAATGGGEDR